MKWQTLRCVGYTLFAIGIVVGANSDVTILSWTLPGLIKDALCAVLIASGAVFLANTDYNGPSLRAQRRTVPTDRIENT
jgi:hypothetical protein